MGCLIDMSGRQKGWRDAVDGDAVFLRQVAQAVQLIHGGVEAALADFRISADVADAVPREVLEVSFIRGGALAAQFHQDSAGLRLRPRVYNRLPTPPRRRLSRR